MRVLRLPLYPFPFALFPLVSLYARNSDTLGIRSLLVPMAIALLVVALLLIGFSLLLHDRWRAAAAASLVILSLFLYPTFVGALALVWLPSDVVCLGLWAAGLAGSLVIVARTRRDLAQITAASNVMALVALSAPLLGLAPSLWANIVAAESAPRVARNALHARSAPAVTVDASDAGAPDIYYIILDGYARQDVLAEYYGLDNSAFIDFLRERGFYVASASRSNYAQTYLSLASSLNQTYLDDVAQLMGPSSDDRQPLAEMIANNRAAAFLRDKGYSFISFATGYTATEIPTADIYVQTTAALSEFQYLLFDATPLSALSRAFVGGDIRYAAHRNRILHTLDSLGRPLGGRRPQFVFAHVVAPHPPFVFGVDGEVPNRGEPFSLRDGTEAAAAGQDEYVTRYRQQLAFLNAKVMQALDRILSTSPPPIVVLQSDHGPGSRWHEHDVSLSDHWERMSILNAYFFPDRNYARLYSTITPVNTFRVIFAQYLGEDTPLLADRNYSSPWDHPYAFVDVSERQHGPTLAAPHGSIGGAESGGHRS